MVFKICANILMPVAGFAQMKVKLVFEALAMLMLVFGMF